LLTTGKAAKKAGVSRQTLQYYLMVGILKPTQVTSTGRRMFDHKAVESIKLINELNQSGYPLREIREVFFEGKGSLKGAESE